MLTKSLHTVTAAANVAAYLLATRSYPRNGNGRALASDALSVLGYPGLVPFAGEDIADPTVTRVVAACARLLTDAKPAAKPRDVGARYAMPGASLEDVERAYGPHAVRQ